MLDAILEILKMGGYAWYVWSAYGIFLAVLFFNVILAVKDNNKVQRMLLAIYREQIDA